MKIVIDTSILRQDFFMNSRKFEMLRDFVSKTEHEIILPEVVYMEIVSLYERKLREKYANLIKSKNEWEEMLAEKIDASLPELDLTKQIYDFIRCVSRPNS